MKIVYLLGAGASYNAIPVINGDEVRKDLVDYINDVLYDFVNNLGCFKNINSEDLNFAAVKKFAESNDFYTARQFIKYNTPDTYARSLFLKGQTNTQEYRNIKLTLSLFFILWWFAHKDKVTLTNLGERIDHFESYDSRYVSFLASVLKPGKNIPVFPESIKVISWNYDSQLEDVLFNFFGSGDRFYAKNINKHFKIACPGITEAGSEIANIIKLNGTYHSINITHNDDPTSINDFHNLENAKQFQEQIARFNTFYLGRTDWPPIHFSWENFHEEIDDLSNKSPDPYYDTMLDRILIPADKLIVIGYSFPVFNRELDGKMIQKFLSVRKGEKTIHVQNSSSAIAGITQRIHALSGDPAPITILPETGLDEFYIPFQFK